MLDPRDEEPRLRHGRDDGDNVAQRGQALDKQADDKGRSRARPIHERSRGRVSDETGKAVCAQDHADSERRDAQHGPEIRQNRKDDAAAEPDEERARDDGVDDAAAIAHSDD
jgi:hypothetical protein